MIIKTRKDLAAYVKTSPAVVEAKKAYDHEEDWKEVEKELVQVLNGMQGCPDYGEDWGAWLEDNIDEAIEEAVSIVM